MASGMIPKVKVIGTRIDPNTTMTLNMEIGSCVIFAMRLPIVAEGYMFEYWNASPYDLSGNSTGALTYSKSTNSSTLRITNNSNAGSVPLMIFGAEITGIS